MSTEIEPSGDEQPESNKRVRRTQAERRAEIGEATYRLLGKHGMNGTTVHRIAEAVGVTAQALYAHFDSRNDMLVAAMDSVYERVSRWLRISSNPNMLERLRETGQAHSSFMAAELGFVIPVFEFVLAPRDSDLASRFGRQQLQVLGEIAALVEQGKEQGTIRQDMDPMLAAWQLIVFAWSEDIARLMSREEYISEGYSASILDLFIRDMAPPEAPQKD
ncbi:MAG: TetR/AcrR family transcriptional regulator [bacterium]